MGTTVASLHVRTDDPDSLTSTLDRLGASPRHLAQSGAWTTVWSPKVSPMDDAWLREAAQALSSVAPTLALVLHDSDVAWLWLYEQGRPSCEVCTDPGWPEDTSPATFTDAEALARLCDAHDADGVRALLDADPVFADDHVGALADALGLSATHALTPWDDRPSATEALEGELVDGPGAPGGLEDLLGGTGLEDLLGGDAGGLMDALGKAFQAQAASPDVPASDADRAFVDAADRGNLAALQQALDAGQAVDAVAPWRPAQARSGMMAGLVPEVAVTALFAAASQGQADAITLLGEADADPDLVIAMGETPLSAAAAGGHAEAVEALLDAGADPLAARANGRTARQAAAETRAKLAAMRPMLDNPLFASVKNMVPGGGELPPDEAFATIDALLAEAEAEEG